MSLLDAENAAWYIGRMPKRKDTAGRDTRLLICILLVIGTTAAYWQVFGNGFTNYDDGDYISLNPHVKAGLKLSGIVWAFTTAHAANWHPLTWISHMLDVQLFGLNPMGHHAVSLFLHIAAAVLLFLLFDRMTGSVWKSAFVAAVFAVHPLHVESVAWASERKDVLSGLFWMLTILAYIRYTEQPHPRRYILVMVVFALGLMAKPMLVTLPLVLLMLDYWPLQRLRIGVGGQGSGVGNLKSAILEKAPLFAMTAVSCVITFVAQQRGGAVSNFEVVTLGIRFENAFTACVRYISKAISPLDLSVFYPYPINGLPAWQIAGAIAFVVLATAAAVLARRRYPYVTVGWLWYLVTLIPVIGLVQVGSQSMADRYMYIPMIGLSIIVAWGVPEMLKRADSVMPNLRLSDPKYVTCLLVLVFGGYLTLTWFQVGYWRDSYTLFEHARAVTDEQHCYDAEFMLGRICAADGRTDEALRHYRKALELEPRSPDANNGLGLLLALQGDVDAALEHISKAVRVQPDRGELHFNLATVYFAKERYADAWEEVRLSRQCGYKPPRTFVEMLSRKMPATTAR